MVDNYSIGVVTRIPFGQKVQDLMYVFADGVIEQVARCIASEVKDRVTHTWLAAHRWGVPMEEDMKKKLLRALYEIWYELFHDRGPAIYFKDTVDNSWPEDDVKLRRRVYSQDGAKLKIVVAFSDSCKTSVSLPLNNLFHQPRLQI